MKKVAMMGGQTQEVWLAAYGKKKLLGYADSFCDLARSFTYQGKETEKCVQDRQERLLNRRLVENREILADHLNEIAGMMRTLAEETYQVQPFRDRELKKLIHACKEQGMLVRSIYRTKDTVRGMRLIAELCAMPDQVLTLEDAADCLSVLFDKRMVPEKDNLFFLSKDYETFVFEEEAPFHVLSGAAKATRENEAVSGDTYSVIENGNGSLILALSDGMGSGEKAMADSETVIDLLERFIEAGFSKETAIEMINGVLIARSEEENMSTLDICDIDLYTGSCEFIKVGASYTYIKRGDTVEQIAAKNLPLGVFHKLDLDKQHCQIGDGDYVIMVSDGIVDGVGSEELLCEMLAQLTLQNPQEISNYILQFVLHKTMGRIQDDMTVLTVGIWENGMRTSPYGEVDFPD